LNKYLLIAVLVVVGCGEEPKEQPKPVSQPASTQAASTSAPASAPKIKGDLYQVESHSMMEECSKKKKKDATEPPFISVEKVKEGATVVYECDAKKECKETPLFVVADGEAPEYACSSEGKKSDFEKKAVTLTMKDDTLAIEIMEYALPGQKGKCPEEIGKVFEKNKKKAKCSMQENITAKKVK
jgi:hypothetical protein